MIRRLKRLICKLGWLLPSQFHIEQTKEAPLILKDKKVYLIGEPDPDMVCLKCPGGCGKAIYLNLDEDASPSWRIVSKRGITIHPSIWNQMDCGCHFWIRNGKVEWCNK